MAAADEHIPALLTCDVYNPARMAGLRRLRKAARRAHVIVTPPTNAAGVLRALDAGADKRMSTGLRVCRKPARDGRRMLGTP